MAKFSGSVVQPGQVTDVERDVIAGAPVQELQERVPQAGGSLDDLLTPELPEGPLPEGAIQEGVEAGIAAEEQIARERIPTLRERGADTTTVQRWNPKVANTVPHADGGLRARSVGLAEMFSGDGAFGLGITPKPDAREAALAGDVAAVAQAEAGTLTGALNRSGAVTTTQDPVSRSFNNAIDPMMLQVGSAVTENELAGAAFGDTEEGVTPIDEKSPAPTVTKQQNNATLGQQIHREYSRMKNAAQGRATDDYQDLPKAEATVLGDAFKEMWAMANPTLIKRDSTGDQVVFQLTPEGVEALKKGSVDRKRLFPKVNVRPTKAPTPTGQLIGEQQQVVKKHTGKVKARPAGEKVLKQATQNLNKVPNVVDRRREKILYLTILPVLSGQLGIDTWQADINNMGPGKMQKFLAAQAKAERNGQDYNAEEEMVTLQNVIAQEVRAIAQERNGANYLTYQIQNATGRINPQQTYFDPTSSKAVRFVTRNAVPAKATPGSRIERNLRQMYAMMLVKGADSLLPEGRDKALSDAMPKLVRWGERLQEMVDGAMSDSQLDLVANAITQGTPLTDPNFPHVEGLALDPTQDKDLIKAIQEKGEDGPHFIDGLIDLANYARAKQEGKPHLSYFNAYVDGKTNGIASNGIQMGSETVARATGVIRNNTQQLLDDGDIRDQLKKDLLNRLGNEAFDGTMPEDTESLYEVARHVFSYRDLNKATTMTFGYGKEMASFKQDVDEAIDFLAQGEAADAVAIMDNEIGREALVDMMHKYYIGSLAGVMSDEALQSRALMRSAAMLHAVTNQLFSITSPTGFALNMGGEANLPQTDQEPIRYRITQEGETVARPSAIPFATESTSAAIKRETDDEGRVSQTPGQDAYGQSVTSPVQSLDAATVAMSVTGKSWDKLKAASNGNPYVHTIYDAFKFDAMGFDVGVEEVNKNWLGASMDWSYLEETYDSTKQAMSAWNKETAQLPQSTQVDVSLDGPYKMIGYLLTRRDGKFTTLFNRMQKLMDKSKEEAEEAGRNILKAVGNAGYRGGDTMTIGQVRAFVNAFAKELDLSSRLDKMIKVTNHNKKQLKKRIDAQKRHHGNEVLQYYAH